LVRDALTTDEGEDFRRRLGAAIRKEVDLGPKAALADYDALLARAREDGNRSSDPGGARIAEVQARRGSALAALGRKEEARRALDEALEAARKDGRTLPLARALLAAGVFAAHDGDSPRAEAFMLEALRRFYERGEDEEHRQGAGWAFVNLGWLYGKTGRLDIAFVTFEKARQILFALGDWAGVAATWEAQGRLRQALGDDDRGREDLAEAVVFYRKEGMDGKADRIRRILGRKKLV
jgi:tetratricopeptide (TPR) repeat protein